MNKYKVALITGIRRIELSESDWRDPEPGYVTFETYCSGICGSDLHVYDGHWDAPKSLATGHEASGIIRAVGKGVTGLNIGDRVTFECFSHCGECIYCLNGQYNHCLQRKGASEGANGGFSEFTTAHSSSIYKIPDEMSFEQGALVEPLAVAYRAVAQSGASYLGRLAVIGGGTIGQLCLAVAVSAGVRESLITVKYDCQEALAKDFRGNHVININGQDLRERVGEITGGLGMDAVIVTVKGEKALDDALHIVRKRGTVVLLAGYSELVKASLGTVVSKEIVLTGSNCYGYDNYSTDFQTCIDLIQSNRVDVTKLVTHRHPLDDISVAFQTASDKQSGAIKVHICKT